MLLEPKNKKDFPFYCLYGHFSSEFALFCSVFRVIPLVILLGLCHCSQRLIGKEKQREINDYYDGKTYTLLEDVKISQEEVWKKGSIVKIYIESTPSLLKLKFYPVNESRESSLGKMAAFIINEDAKKRQYEFEDVEEWVALKFAPYDTKSKKTKK
ncbi:type II secretion system-associated lipoprotein [Leptospira sp. 96542]|nr:type II secretion system-associated lipoprotein [Leptospira sp. 96542]